MKDLISLASIGFLSGLAVVLFAQTPSDTLEFITAKGTSPEDYSGVIYGVITGIYFVSVSQLSKKYVRYITWVIASGVSYVMGVATAVATHENLFVAREFAYACGGFVGAAILALGFHFVFHKINLTKSILISVAGAVIAFASHQIARAIDFEVDTVVYITWQTVITVLIGYFTRSHSES